MTLMCIERSQSPTHKGAFLQGGKSAVSNINHQNTNHNRRNSCSPPLKTLDAPAKSPSDSTRSKSEKTSGSNDPTAPSDRRSAQSNSSRYKTELCRPYEENGSCKYGDKCQFAHGRKELRSMARHPKYKTELCRTFHSTGLCPYGPRCHFIHNSEQTKKSLLTTLTGPTGRHEEPRSSLGSDGEVSPPSSNGGSPTEAKSFDDIFQQPNPLGGFYPQEAIFNNFQRILDYGVLDYKSEYYEALNMCANEKYVSSADVYNYRQSGPVLDLCPVGPMTPPQDISVGGFRLPIFDGFQKV